MKSYNNNIFTEFYDNSEILCKNKENSYINNKI